MKPYFNLFNYRNIINIMKFNNQLRKKEKLLLGRWNSKNKDKYMDWGNYDNCFTSQFRKPNKN